MALVNLAKGSKGVAVNLSKESNGGLHFAAELFWKTSDFGGQDVDLDILAVLTGADGTVLNDDARNLVFYNNAEKASACKAVTISEDNQTGGTIGSLDPEEWCKLDFSKIDPAVVKVDLIIDIHQAENRRQNFGLVNDGKCIIKDVDNNREIVEYWFDSKPTDTGLLLCEFVKRGTNWVFKAKEEGYVGGLGKALTKYGIVG